MPDYVLRKGADGSLAWARAHVGGGGSQGPQGPQGPQGIDGPQGPQGDPGPGIDIDLQSANPITTPPVTPGEYLLYSESLDLPRDGDLVITYDGYVGTDNTAVPSGLQFFVRVDGVDVPSSVAIVSVNQGTGPAAVTAAFSRKVRTGTLTAGPHTVEVAASNGSANGAVLFEYTVHVRYWSPA